MRGSCFTSGQAAGLPDTASPRNQFEVNGLGAARLAQLVLPLGSYRRAYTRTSTSSCRPSAPSSRSAA